MNLHTNIEHNRVPDRYCENPLEMTAGDYATVLADRCIETVIKLEIKSVDPEMFGT